MAELLIAGVDECGRGCLYGHVVAGAVVLRPRDALTTDADRAAYDALTDSKVLSAKRRAALAPIIESRLALAYGIGRATAAEIDDVNILQATMIAMRRALDAAAAALPPPATIGKLLVDGTIFRGWRDTPYECVVKGDLHVKAISAASILAKEARDAEIRAEIAADPARFAPYGLATNVGYGTLAHRRAIAEHGPLPNHRMTFEPLASQLAAAPAPPPRTADAS